MAENRQKNYNEAISKNEKECLLSRGSKRNQTKGACIMTFTNMTNIDKFFETVDKCEGKVELVTEQGDRFNLKSTLAKYVIFVKILSNRTVPSAQIKTYSYADAQKLMKFMMNS